MRGRKSDVLGMEIQRMGQEQGPNNRFIHNATLPGPIVMGVNKTERIYATRTVPFKMVSHQQPILVDITPQREKSFVSGGLVKIPDAALYRSIFKNRG